MKLKIGLFRIMLTLIMFSMTSPVAYAVEKSDMQMAQELIYGKWAKPNSSWIKYEFSEKNIKILEVYKADPMGKSEIKVQMKNNDGTWSDLDTTLWISLVDKRYTMYMIKKRANGTPFIDHDANIKFTKVYWND